MRPKQERSLAQTMICLDERHRSTSKHYNGLLTLLCKPTPAGQHGLRVHIELTS